jgi:alkylated DNA repair protein alkB family protein 6
VRSSSSKGIFSQNVQSRQHLQIPSRRWTPVSGRRVQAHPSTLAKGEVLISSALPDWLTTTPPILERFQQLGVFAETKHKQPNHVLVNEYLPGDGIMPHEDGSAYSPVVATISLGGTLILDIKEKPTESPVLVDASKVDRTQNARGPAPEPRQWRILQEPGSLLVTTGSAYSDLLHGISYVKEDIGLGPDTIANWGLLENAETFVCGKNTRTVRTSLTYRDVLKVTKLGSFLSKKR